jgi:hypothetical protein
MRHLIIRPPQLKAKHGLQVLALQQHIALEPITQIRRVRERRLLNNFVHARREYEAQVVGEAIWEQERIGHDLVRS